MYNVGMSVLDLDKKKCSQSIWSSSSQVYDFFSVFLERQVINVAHLDLSFIPLDYFEQLLNCQYSEDGQGYLNLLMMLFTEFYQEKVTGQHKIRLPEEKYQVMSTQFLIYVQCELLRRDKVISYLNEENLFNPNVKTIFIVDNADGMSDLQTQIQNTQILLREFRPT